MLVKLGLNKKIYLRFSVFIVIFTFLSIQVYAQDAVRPLINRTPYTSDNQTSQGVTANETIESRASIVTSPQTTTPTTSTEQREAQIDPSQKSAYIPPAEDTSPVVVNIQPSAQQSAIEQQEGQIGSPQTNQVSIPSTTPNTEERQEAIMEKEIAMNRCDELKNTNTINYTDEQVRRYKAEMEEVCTPDPDVPHEGAIELPRETEEDRLGELILFKEILNSLSEEEREAALKFEGMTMEYLEKEIERLRNLTTAKNNTGQEIITDEMKKEEGDGFISAVTNIVVGLINGIFSLFR